MKQLYISLCLLLSTIGFGQNYYGVQMKSGSFLFGNNTSYIQAVQGAKSNISTQDAIEIGETGNIYTRNGNEIYFMHFGQSRISRYLVDEQGNLSFDDLVQFPDGPSNPHVVDLLFVDENTAYVLSYGVWEVFIIDLPSMTITGSFDLTSLERPEEESSTLEEMIIRDGKLYVAIWYGSGLVENTPVEGAFLAVCDIATKSLDKLISDDRTYLLGYGSSAVDQMFLHENGDIYVSGTDVVSGGQQTLPGGVLRIKQGETEFDKDYFLNLDKITGDKISIGLEYIGNNIAYTAAQFPEEINRADPFSKYFDATFKYYKVNVATGEAEVLDDTPFTKGFFYTWLTPFGDKFLLPVGGDNNDNGIWLLDAEKNSAEKIISLDAEPFGMFAMAGMPGSLSISEQNKWIEELSVFPNPVAEKLLIGLNSNQKMKSMNLKIVNAVGQVFLEQKQFVPQGKSTIVLDVQQLPTGNYSLVLGNTNTKVAFIKQ